ncbi:MAG: MFS transporter, partial [Pirellulaceae bacterium]
METGRREEESAARTSVHRRIVWISVLMAFGLYLTRVSVGEIVKTDSFLNDPQIVADARTRFSVEVTGARAPERLAMWLETQTQAKMRFPMVLADGVDRQKARQQLEALEAEGGEGRIRISKSQIGDVLGAFFFTYALFQVPAGWICDRLGARRGLASYIFFWSLLTAATAWVGSLPGLLAARLGFGVAQAGAYPASNAIVRRWFPLQTRGRASGLIAFGGRLGGTVAPFLT